MPEQRDWDDSSVAAMWDANAPVWTELARQGYDQYRDCINTPAFLEMLPEVDGLRGLDVGCGEGYNTRLVARRGAHMTALDVSPRFIAQAAAQELLEPLGIRYLLASGSRLPFADGAFQFVISTMCLMDLPDYEGTLGEVTRVLRNGGFFQFSISHPIIAVPEGEWVIDNQGRRTGRVVRGYFDQPSGEVDEWIFGAAPRELTSSMRRFRIPRFPRTLSGWLNPLFEAGLVLERIAEPRASKRQVRKYPRLEDSRIAPYFLLLRCRKP